MGHGFYLGDHQLWFMTDWLQGLKLGLLDCCRVEIDAFEKTRHVKPDRHLWSGLR